MSEPVDTSAEAVRVTNPGYAEYLNSPAGKIITEQREQIVSLQSSLTAAQQRIADLEAQCARAQRDAESMRAKLLELAGECAECGGSGTVMSTSGVIENVRCPDCKDIWDAAGVDPLREGQCS